MTLGGAVRSHLEELAADLPAVIRRDHAEGTTWSAQEREFAHLSDDAVELRLDPAVADAAARTPDAGPCDRGPEWVRFTPRELDDHALDRLSAWFGLAYRRATE